MRSILPPVNKTPEQLAKFCDWVEKWWQNFAKMDAGTAYEIAKCAKSPELFIEVGKDFIDHYEFGHQWEFSNDYKYFKRITKDKL